VLAGWVALNLAACPGAVFLAGEEVLHPWQRTRDAYASPKAEVVSCGGAGVADVAHDGDGEQRPACEPRREGALRQGQGRARKDAHEEASRRPPAGMPSLSSASTHHELDQAQIELSIYNLETSYLTDTASSGNIIHGFDGYLKPTQGAAARRKHEIGDGDRWFSSSSGTWSKACPLDRARPH